MNFVSGQAIDILSGINYSDLAFQYYLDNGLSGYANRPITEASFNVLKAAAKNMRISDSEKARLQQMNRPDIRRFPTQVVDVQYLKLATDATTTAFDLNPAPSNASFFTAQSLINEPIVASFGFDSIGMRNLPNPYGVDLSEAQKYNYLLAAEMYSAIVRVLSSANVQGLTYFETNRRNFNTNPRPQPSFSPNGSGNLVIPNAAWNPNATTANIPTAYLDLQEELEADFVDTNNLILVGNLGTRYNFLEMQKANGMYNVRNSAQFVDILGKGATEYYFDRAITAGSGNVAAFYLMPRNSVMVESYQAFSLELINRINSRNGEYNWFELEIGGGAPIVYRGSDTYGRDMPIPLTSFLNSPQFEGLPRMLLNGFNHQAGADLSLVYPNNPAAKIAAQSGWLIGLTTAYASAIPEAVGNTPIAKYIVSNT